ncbi:MAG: DsbA family oxidoreductase [Chitinophagaceae bacterium]
MPEVKDNFSNNIQQADGIEITYYTDPLCCWSWAFEPQWRKLQFEFSGKISWHYVMGGLLPSWKNYNDPINNVSRPIQMGPVWMHASQVSGIPMHQRIWIEDPPASSYPACIAVKCAELQSTETGEKYLRLLREAIMINGINISKQTELIKIAETLTQKGFTEFTLIKFKEDLKTDKGLEAFRKDLQEVQYRNINRFPTLIIKANQQPPILITGYRPYSILLDAIKQVAPQLQKTQQAINEEEIF